MDLSEEGRAAAAGTEDGGSTPNLDWLGDGAGASEPAAGPDGQGPLEVTLQPWGSGQNDCVWNALKGAGYSDEEIRDQGLVDQVARMNGLEDPGKVGAGQTLQIPRKGEGGSPAAPAAPAAEPGGAPAADPGGAPATEPGGAAAAEPGEPWTPAEEPGPAPAPAAQDGSPIGQAALGYGVDSPKVNPNNGTTDWYGYCLGWVNNAVNSNGGNVSELRTGTALQAFKAAEANGRLQYGNPPPGAIVFFPNGDPGGNGHIGLSLGDGQYRGTVPARENPSTIGDRPIPGLDSVPWMLPYP